ncbi:MAG: DUF6345 domain-containing protein [Phycisphaerae bacterium]
MDDRVRQAVGDCLVGAQEPVAPGSVTTVGDNITIVSNTMTPPGDMAFKEFPSPNPWHFVDIETDPEAPPGSADTDTGSAIKISVEGVPETAGAWPLKGEGNLTPPPGGQGTAEFHWSAKAYKIFPILYKDNTTWTEEARLTSDPVHLFTMDVIAGVEILSAPGKTVKAKMWTGDDTENKVTITLTETGAGTGVYRNTGTDTWPHFYRIYDAANKRLKVMDEDKKWYVVPIVDDKEYPGLEVSEKVDAAEVAAVDGTPSLDAEEIYDDMTADPHNWNGVALYDVNNNKALGTGAKCVELGAQVDLLNVSGHGLKTKAEVYGEEGYGLYNDTFTPSDIGASWDNGELEWLVLASCSQVRVGGDDPWNTPPAATDNGVIWIKAMPKVHDLLGYRDSAPGGGTDVNVANAFAARLHNGDVVYVAWCLANEDFHAWNATALVNVNNIDDCMYTLDDFPTADNPGNEYVFWWWRDEGIIFPDWHLRYRTFTLP